MYLTKNGIVWWKHAVCQVTSFNPSTEMPSDGPISWDLKIHGNPWLYVRKSCMIENNNYPYGLFAAKKFSTDDVIGIYLGEYNAIPKISEGTPSTENVYIIDHIDAKCGMHGKCFMGMHLCNDPLLPKNNNSKEKTGKQSFGRPPAYNAEFKTNLTLVAIKDIRAGTEIKVDYKLHE